MNAKAVAVTWLATTAFVAFPVRDATATYSATGAGGGRAAAAQFAVDGVIAEVEEAAASYREQHVQGLRMNVGI